jgi:hypothetical protein
LSFKDTCSHAGNILLTSALGIIHQEAIPSQQASPCLSTPVYSTRRG